MRARSGRPPRVAYVAGPYRAASEWGVVQNIRRAEAVAVELWQMGLAVITPHLNSALMGGACPDEVWLEGDLEIMGRCDLVVVLPGWERSAGTCREIQVADEKDIPVFHWPVDRGCVASVAAGREPGWSQREEAKP